MGLYERYELLDLNRDIGVKTFEARELATGRPVKVHLFVHPSAPLQAALLKAIDKLPDEQRQRIVERGKHEGTPYVVTDRLADYAGLSEWVQAAGHSPSPAKTSFETAGAWKVPPAPPAPTPNVPTPNAPTLIATTPAPPAPAGPAAISTTASPSNAHSALNQKFTELFATAERPIVADSLLQAPPDSARKIAAPLRPPDPQPPAPAPPAQTKPEPGEFTRMFQSPVAVPSAAAPAPLPPAPAPQAQTPPAPSVPIAAPAPPPRTSPPPAKEPGEFTRMFPAPAGNVATPAPVAPAPAAAPAATKSGPGEFTRFFQTPAPAGPLPQSPAVQQPLAPQASGRAGINQVSEFTRTFGTGTDVPAPPPAVAPQREPGEFTRMFHSPAAAGAPPTAQPPSSAPQAAQPMPPATGGATRGFSIPTPAPVAPQASGPGEYTRQFSAPAQLTFGQNAVTPSAPATAPSQQAFAPPAMAQPAMPNMAAAPAPAKKSNLPLILGIVGIVLVAALLIVFFAMRPK